MTDNVISIKGQSCQTIFEAPTDNGAARALWVFLVENLRPGFVVELSKSASDLTRISGEKLPPDLYAEVIGQARGQAWGYNLIVIEKESLGDRTLLYAPHNDHAAKSLWCFLAENMQPGFVIYLYRAWEITDPFGRKMLEATAPGLTWRSADKLPPGLYAKVMGERPNQEDV